MHNDPPGKLESQSSKGNETENRVDEIPKSKMPLYYEINDKDIKEPKEEIVETPTSFKTNKVREPLSLSSFHKAKNPYRSPIPPVYHPKEDQKENPLKMKVLGSFMVNISIEVKRRCKRCSILGRA